MKTLYLANRVDWRSWLEKNFDKEREVWLVYYKKGSGKPRIQYNDAVEEALCFGWIDSTVRSIDEEHYAQRFSPRRAKSSFSQQNKERLKWLLKNKLIHESVINKVKEVLKEELVIPPDIIKEIQKDKTAWSNYQQLSDSYKRIRIAYIEDARKRPEEFRKRLNNFILKTRENKMIGYGGIKKYY